MLKTMFVFLQRFLLPIMIVVGIAGIACNLTSGYLKTYKCYISVAYYKKLTRFLDIASSIFMFINLVLLCMFVWDVFRGLFPYIFQMGI